MVEWSDFLDDSSVSSNSDHMDSQETVMDPGKEICYLNYASQSPLHPFVQEAGFKAIQRPPWEVHDNQYQEEVRTLFASLVGSESKDIAIMPSTAFAITFVASNIKRIINSQESRGRKILLLQDQMCSAVYGWQRLADTCDIVTLDIVPYPYLGGGTWTKAVLDRIDDNVLVACLPPLHWSDGALLDLVKIGEKCMEHNVTLIVDATQAVGIMPLDVSSIRPTVVAASVHKWLRGPVGMCSLVYVSPDVHDLWEPLDEHGRSRIVNIENADQNEMGPNGYSEKFVRDARKFDSGGKPNPIMLPMLRAGLSIATKVNLYNVQDELEELCRPILDWANKNGFSYPPGHRAHHLIGIRPATKVLSPKEMIQICEKLAKHDGVFIAVRCGAFRISPYVDTKPRDIQNLLTCLDRHIG